jgi:hypothetical protein
VATVTQMNLFLSVVSYQLVGLNEVPTDRHSPICPPPKDLKHMKAALDQPRLRDRRDGKITFTAFADLPCAGSQQAAEQERLCHV